VKHLVISLQLQEDGWLPRQAGKVKSVTEDAAIGNVQGKKGEIPLACEQVSGEKMFSGRRGRYRRRNGRGARPPWNMTGG